jgi:hypothetical protein
MSELPTRGQQTQVRLGCLATLLVQIICKHPEIAYSYALHAKLAETYGDKYSRTDVSRALYLLAGHKILVAHEENPDKPNGRVFYHPTWLAGLKLGLLLPTKDWPSYC